MFIGGALKQNVGQKSKYVYVIFEILVTYKKQKQQKKNIFLKFSNFKALISFFRNIPWLFPAECSAVWHDKMPPHNSKIKRKKVRKKTLKTNRYPSKTINS